MKTRPEADFSSPLCQPYEVRQGEHGVLLMHGFAGSAAHMRPLAEGIVQQLKSFERLTVKAALSGKYEDAYVAMVEENEIRVGLSFYERARIAAKSVEAGVYPDDRAALRALFADREQYRAMSARNRRKAEQQFSLQQMARQYDQLFTQLVQEISGNN